MQRRGASSTCGGLATCLVLFLAVAALAPRSASAMGVEQVETDEKGRAYVVTADGEKWMVGRERRMTNRRCHARMPP